MRCTSKPPFRLVYSRTPLTAHGVDLAVWAHFSTTLYGSLVKYQNRFATIALNLEIDGVDHLLTVEHICVDQLDPESVASVERNLASMTAT